MKSDYAQAMQWYRKGANAGGITAMRNIGRMYADGLGVEKNPDEAARWLEKANLYLDHSKPNGQK